MKTQENKSFISNSSNTNFSQKEKEKEKSKGKEKIDSWIDDVIKQHKQRK
jgi:hypothetical protein